MDEKFKGKSIRQIINLRIAEGLPEHISHLERIKAPEVILENRRDILNKALNNEIKISKLENFENWEVIDFADFKGRGGKVFTVFHTKQGDLNYLPQARFGRFVALPDNKKAENQEVPTFEKQNYSPEELSAIIAEKVAGHKKYKTHKKRIQSLKEKYGR